MTYSIVNELLPFVDKTTKELKEYLEDINIRMFNVIFANFCLKEEAKYIVLFIILAYSEESPYLIKDADATLEKEAILERIQAPEYIHDWLITLYDDKGIILNAVYDYVDYFPSSDFKRLKTLQNAISDLQGMVSRKEFINDKQVFDTKEYLSALRVIDKLLLSEAKLKMEIKNKNKTTVKYTNLELELAKLKGEGKTRNNESRNLQFENAISENINPAHN
jgi:hypothetical protein